MAREVVCVTRDEDAEHDDYRRVEFVGYLDEDGQLARASPDEVEKGVDTETDYYVLHHGDRVYLEAVEEDGETYVRAAPASTPSDALETLPDCDDYGLD